MTWSHPSLESRPPEYQISNGRITMGNTIITYIYLNDETHMLRVRAPGGRMIGIAATPAEALLMAVHDRETPRQWKCHWCGVTNDDTNESCEHCNGQ